MKEEVIQAAANTKRNPVENPPMVIKSSIEVNEVPEHHSPQSLFRVIDQNIFEYLCANDFDVKLTSTLFVENGKSGEPIESVFLTGAEFKVILEAFKKFADTLYEQSVDKGYISEEDAQNVVDILKQLPIR